MTESASATKSAPNAFKKFLELAKISPMSLYEWGVDSVLIFSIFPERRRMSLSEGRGNAVGFSKPNGSVL